MRRLFAFALVCGMTTSAAAQVIWDNGPPVGRPFSSQLDTCYAWDSQTADDFKLPTGPGGEPRWDITDVIWSGGYWNGPPSPGDFRIIFYADAGGRPTGGPSDPTGTALAVYDFTFAEVNETPNSVGGYDYNVTLPTPLTVDALTTYWLVAQSPECFPPQWGFDTSPVQQMSEVMFGFPVLGYHYWTPSTSVFGLPHDVSFQLWGAPHGGDWYRSMTGRRTRRQNLALLWLPRRSMARSRSPSWLNRNSG